MTIKQLSVFLENKTGRINEVTKILGKHSINMHAFSMAETTDFGILRLIVSEVDKAVEILRNADFAVMLTDVVCISMPNVAGSLSDMYAFADGEKANVVIRPNDIDKCITILNECSCNIKNDF